MVETRKPMKPLSAEVYEEEYAVMPAPGEHFRFCPGCGLGIVLSALMRAFHEMELDPSKVVTVGGSGCYAILGGHLRSSQLHGPHGSASAMATGIKLARPELTVVCLQGDGDAVSIGAGHFVHAARRNLDITTLVFNNFVFGETGGQSGPTTPPGSVTTTTPYGAIENPFDICNLAIGAGATYVARVTVSHAWMMNRLFAKALSHKGFSVVEVLQNCHELWGRRNSKPTATDMLNWYRENSITVAQAKSLPDDRLAGKFIIGELHTEGRPELGDAYQGLTQRVKRQSAKAQ